MLSLKEWNLDWFVHQFILMPIKLVGRKMKFLNFKAALVLFIIILIGAIAALQNEAAIPAQVHRFLPELIGLFGLLLVAKSFVERQSVMVSWTLVLMNNILIALAISFNEHFEYSHIILYLSGGLIAGALGYFCFIKLKQLEKEIDLTQFYGHSYKYPRLAFLFLLACLGLSGFPITPTFIGEDLIYTHIQEHQASLAIIVSLSFIIDGLALIRIYSRLFLGPHVKRFHDVGFRSS
jgi:hypothetical protein